MQSYSGTLDLHTSTSISLVCKAYKIVILSKSALEQGATLVCDRLKFGDAKISNTFWVLEISNIFFWGGGGGGGGER